jgi:endogenous inhibitor of DNA gyrase (YacG/DUF329 family)
LDKRIKSNSKIKFLCETCGKEKEVYKSSNNSHRFCSLDCYHKSKLGDVEIICGICGKSKVVRKVYVNRGQYKYCSNECRGKAVLLEKRGTPSKTKLCLVCEKEFEASNGRTKFCSPECQRKEHGIWVKENQSGENNPFYNKNHTLETRKHLSKVKKELFAQGILVPVMKGKGKGRSYVRSKDLEWRLLAEKIKNRDGNKCVLCNSTVRLDAHHIIPYRICKENKEENLITLCREHHKKTYQKEMEFAELFQGKLKGIYGQETSAAHL